MIEEILGLGVDQVELGYDLRPELVSGVKKMISNGSVHVTSVHNFCPVPTPILHGHPELFTMASSDGGERRQAVEHTINTIRFAAEIGAAAVVIHCGYVDTKTTTAELIRLCEKNQQLTNYYEKIKLKLVLEREKKVTRHLIWLRAGIEQLLPVLKETGIRLGLENLPSWEALPTEIECMQLIALYGNDHLCYWHDVGHGQIRENLGFINHHKELFRMTDMIGGMHLHDVRPPASDHQMPPGGMVDFEPLIGIIGRAMIAVVEPHPGLSGDEVNAGITYLKKLLD